MFKTNKITLISVSYQIQVTDESFFSEDSLCLSKRDVTGLRCSEGFLGGTK